LKSCGAFLDFEDGQALFRTGQRTEGICEVVVTGNVGFCPTGKSLLIFRNGVKPVLQKYFCFLPRQISSLIRTSRSDRGALRNVINVERDAVDAGSARDERGLLAYGEVVWF
jgi:hypothetical protein